MSNNSHQKNINLGNAVFWATIFLLAAGSIGATLPTLLKSPDPKPEYWHLPDLNEEPPEIKIIEPYEIDPTTFEKILSGVGKEALQLVKPNVNEILNEVYQPVYGNIPEYAEDHYSVIGEYLELKDAALGQMSEKIYERLFDGYEQRMENALEEIDDQIALAYQETLKKNLAEQIPADKLFLPFGKRTASAIQKAMRLPLDSLPIYTTVGGVLGAGGIKVVTKTIAKKLAAKITIKAAAKTAGKGAGAMTGATVGAAACAWTGPGAFVCGVVGGVVAWFATDAVIVNIDEFFNRDEFEAELRALIDADREEKRQLIEGALDRKALALDEAAKNIVPERFTPGDLSTTD